MPDWSLLEKADIETEKGRSALRKGIVRPLVLRGDYGKAHSIQEVILHHSGELQDFLQLARLQGQSGESDRAITTLQSARDIVPDDLDVARAYLAASLKSPDTSIAAKAAKQTQHLWSMDGSIADNAARALYRFGDMTAALDAVSISVPLNRSNSAAITFAASVYNAAGQASNARDTLADSSQEAEDRTGKRAFELARALFQLDPASGEARRFLCECHTAEPDNYRYAHLYSNCLYSRGDYDAALAIIEGARTMDRSFVAAVLYAKCLRQLRRYDDAVKILDPIVGDDSVADSVLRFATGVYLLAGKQEIARELDERARKTAIRRMPTDVKTELAQLRSKLGTANIPQARLDWAWQHVRANAKTPLDRQTWEDEVRWVNLADACFRDCLEHLPSEHEAIADLLDGTQHVGAVLTAALAHGKGVILASAHVGAMFSGPIALAKTGLPISVVASTPDLGNGRISSFDDIRLISAASNDVVGLTRGILRHLAQNRVVVIAIDGTSFPGGPRYNLFDRSIALSDFVPRRVFKANTPTFYTDVRWSDGRLNAGISSMPQPLRAETETEPAFVERWMGQYTRNLTTLFVDSPHNLRMAGGFWNTIKM